MVNLQALEAAIGKVERIRDHEFCFEVDGCEVCLVPLRADEETEVQRYSQVAMEGVTTEDGNQAAFADFMDRMRHSSLAFSIIQIGELDLRDVEFIETGEQDEKGNPISVPKWEAVRDLMAREWSRTMLAQVFAKFGEMLERLELRAQKAVSFEPVDLQEEIERTERRLKELKDTHDNIRQPQGSRIPPVERAPRATPPTSTPTPTPPVEVPPDVQAAVDEVVEGVPPQQPQQPQGRRSAIPSSAPTPERRAAPGHPETPQDSQQQQPPPQGEPQQEVDEQNVPVPHEGDSFFDPSDPDAAMEAEAKRQAILHQRHIAKQRAAEKQRVMREEMGMPSEEEMNAERLAADRAAKSPRGVSLDKSPGGLRSAANASDAILDSGAGSVRSGRPQPQPPQGGGTPAKLHGKPVYKMPSQNLDRSAAEQQRQHGEPPPSPVINSPSPGGRQTKFRGPQQ